MENQNIIDSLINHVNKYLIPKYELTVEDIPAEFINVDINITKSTKCVCLTKKGDDVTYNDWYYEEFNLENLKDYCYITSFIDRDREISLAYEFKDISQKITLALNNYKL